MAGRYVVTESSSSTDTVCGDCVKGKASSGGQASCDSCDGPGEYSDIDVTSSCMTSPAGFTPDADRTGVSPCEPETFSAGGSCISCEDGFYSGSGFSYCSPCPAGKYGAEDHFECLSCKLGQHSGIDAYKACSLCEEGKFSDTPNSEVCTFCPDYHSSEAASDSCSCSESFVSIIDPITQEPGCTCPPGRTLEKGVCVVCDPGFFKETYR